MMNKNLYKIMLFTVCCSASLFTGCGGGDSQPARVDVDVEISQALSQLETPMNRLNSVPDGEGLSFAEQTASEDEVSAWMQDVVDVVKTAIYNAMDQLEVLDEPGNFTNSSNPLIWDGNGAGQAEAAHLSRRGQKINETADLIFKRTDILYEGYSHDYADIRLSGSSLRVEKWDCSSTLLGLIFIPCSNKVKDLAASLTVSGGTDLDGHPAGYRARVAFDLHEEGDLTNEYSGEAEIESGGKHYRCVFSQQRFGDDSSVPKTVCEEHP